MGHFLYFAQTQSARGDIDARTAQILAPVLADTGRMSVCVPDPLAHPCGTPGVLIRPDVPGFPVERMQIDRSMQEWRQWGPGLWVGMWLDWAPGPEDLQRRDLLEGFDVKLEDGNAWRVPLLKFYTSRPALAGQSALPQAVEFDSGGEAVLSPLRKHRALSEAAEGLWQAIVDLGEGETQDGPTRREKFETMIGRTTRIAPQALALNYRVTAAECSLLQLFTTRNLAAVGLALCDYDGFAEMFADVKKNAGTAGAGQSG